MNQQECYLVCDPYGGWSVFWIDEYKFRQVVVDGCYTMEECLRKAAQSLGKPICVKIVPPPTV